MTKNIWQKSSEKTAICNTFDVLSHLLIFELGGGSLPCRRHKFQHINTAEQFLNGSLHFLLLPIFLISSPKAKQKTINLVVVFENRKNSSCSLLGPLYLELAHICPRHPGGELLGEIWEWVSRSLSVLLSRLSCSDSPSSPPKILAQTHPRQE